MAPQIVLVWLSGGSLKRSPSRKFVVCWRFLLLFSRVVIRRSVMAPLCTIALLLLQLSPTPFLLRKFVQRCSFSSLVWCRWILQLLLGHTKCGLRLWLLLFWRLRTCLLMLRLQNWRIRSEMIIMICPSNRSTWLSTAVCWMPLETWTRETAPMTFSTWTPQKSWSWARLGFFKNFIDKNFILRENFAVFVVQNALGNFFCCF